MTGEQRLPLYWSLLASTFPIFFDTCKSIGTIAEYRDTVTLTQTRHPVYDKLGSRNIIHQAVKKVFQTLKDFELLSACGKPGTFSVVSHKVSDRNLVNYLAVAILSSSNSEYLTWEAIVGSRALFPFNIEHVTEFQLTGAF